MLLWTSTLRTAIGNQWSSPRGLYTFTTNYVYRCVHHEKRKRWNWAKIALCSLMSVVLPVSQSSASPTAFPDLLSKCYTVYTLTLFPRTHEFTVGWDLHMKGEHVILFLLSVGDLSIFCNPIHFSGSFKSSLFFTAESLYCVYVPHFHCLFICWQPHLGPFAFLGVVNRAVIKHGLFGRVWNSLHVPGSGISGTQGSSIFIFPNFHNWFPNNVLIGIPTRNEQGLLFLQIPTNTYQVSSWHLKTNVVFYEEVSIPSH